MKRLLRIIIEKITGRTCDKCKHCISDISCDNMPRYVKCVTSIYPNRFEPVKKKVVLRSDVLWNVKTYKVAKENSKENNNDKL